MDHAHGHTHPVSQLSPSTDNLNHASTQRRRPFSTPARHSPFTPPPPYEAPASAHQRRLQLRNLGFRAPQVSAQKLGARFSRLINGNEESRTAPAREKNQENRRGLRATRSEYNLNSSLGILNEISNSTRSLNQSKRATIPIYEDDPERPLLDASSPVTPTTQYHDASSTHPSPLGFHYIENEPAAMRLQEVSGNERRHSPSFSSPPSSTGRGKNTKASTRKSSFEATEYIEHIEKQLEQVKEAMHSPRSGKPLPEKMKVLKSENRRLKKIIEELEGSFEARVKNSVEHMTTVEGELRKRIKVCEDEVREKDATIEELEYYYDQSRLDQATLENLKSTIDRLETEKSALEDTNRSMEKRNEVLTELLAFSPTKSHHGLELASPLRRAPRPKSMFMRFPSSPNKNRPHSTAVSTAVSPEGYFSPQSTLDLELGHPCDHAEDANSGLGESCSAKSPLTSSSRRSTLQSQASISPSIWGLPMPTSPDDGKPTIKQPNKRKPRRFMTGSTQLKPLLLPSMAAESAEVTSPRSPDRCQTSEEPADFYQPIFIHKLEGSQNPARREVFDQSIGPAVSFLSNPFEEIVPTQREFAAADLASSPLLSPLNDCSSPPRMASLADEIDVTGFLHPHMAQDVDAESDVQDDATAMPPNVDYEHSGFQLNSVAQIMGPEEPSNASLSSSSPVDKDPSRSSPHPRKRRRTSSIPISVSNSPTSAPSFRTADPGSNFVRPQLHHAVNPVSLVARVGRQENRSPLASPKRLPRSTSPLEILQRRNASSSPLAAVTIRSIYGTLSRYTAYIREFKRDPLALARRVIANAWCNNWKRFGKFSWWVLGIFLSGSKSDQGEQLRWDWDQYDGEAVADRICCPANPTSHPQNRNHSPTRETSPDRRVRLDKQYEGYLPKGPKASAKPASKDGKEKRVGLGKSLYLWGKFSVAIMLAVGGAVWKGPGEMLKDCDHTQRSPKRVSVDHCSQPCDVFWHNHGHDSHYVPTSHPSPPSRVLTFGSPPNGIGWEVLDDYGGPKPSRWADDEADFDPNMNSEMLTPPVREGVRDTHSLHD